jgi:hypothetical protein
MSDEDELTPAELELETALRSLRPTPARINPVAASIAGRRTARRRTVPGRLRFLQIAAAAAAIAVGGGAWLALGPHGQMPDRVERQPPVSEPDLAAAIELSLEPPTLLVYRRALAQSALELEALLDRQATTGATPDNQFRPASVLTLWNANLHPSLGDM